MSEAMIHLPNVRQAFFWVVIPRNNQKSMNHLPAWILMSLDWTSGKASLEGWNTGSTCLIGFQAGVLRM